MNHPQVWTTINKTAIDISLLSGDIVTLIDWSIYHGRLRYYWRYNTSSILFGMYNGIKNKHKGDCIILITIITGIYYIDLRVVITFVLDLNFGNVCYLY